MDARLPAHLEVSGLIRSVEAAGGFAAVLSKGERDAGTIMVVIAENGANARAYERMPQLDGTRDWSCSKKQDPENKSEFSEYLERRGNQDPDLWIVELDVANGERFIGQS
ncbi:DUF1491 family protein [Novosphingobium mangrovi (ex Huang et al. 2023)]|uniref:DUF1491 family protein n=1 Tax=Novosphingobium mangrovi (ex Huang et al. 2023) TaxID=2976432 RepID=A0ABT2I9Q7_9SPHN|nr:DUF1491 family protein [Novosphingobium mangrovi (ex Huang et al. 2023)]MCT2401293.1 DUF1491 family protein [Novosphingobium mangrovi (ex Huang et al. 2023)]